MAPARQFTFYEFFAGGGMARAGLGEDWRCLFANDFDAKKVDAYRANWGDGEVVFEMIVGLHAHRMENVARDVHERVVVNVIRRAGLRLAFDRMADGHRRRSVVDEHAAAGAVDQVIINDIVAEAEQGNADVAAVDDEIAVEQAGGAAADLDADAGVAAGGRSAEARVDNHIVENLDIAGGGPDLDAVPLAAFDKIIVDAQTLDVMRETADVGRAAIVGPE